MRPTFACFAIAFVLASCSSPSYSLKRPDGGRFASLGMEARPGAETWKDYHGIHSIDGHTVSLPVDAPIYVMEGRRRIGYLCPGSINVDAWPELSHDFQAGKTYVLDCTAKASIHEASR